MAYSPRGGYAPPGQPAYSPRGMPGAYGADPQGPQGYSPRGPPPGGAYGNRDLGELERMLETERFEKEQAMQQYATLSAEKQKWEAERAGMRRQHAQALVSPRGSGPGGHASSSGSPFAGASAAPLLSGTAQALSPRASGGESQWQSQASASFRPRDSLEQFLDGAKEWCNPNAGGTSPRQKGTDDVPVAGTSRGEASGDASEEFFGQENKQVLDTSALDQTESLLKGLIENKSGFEAYPIAFIQSMFRRVEPVTASVWVEMVTGKKLMFQGNNSHLRALFRRYDANQNGQMTSKELCDALFSSEGRPNWLRGKIREVLILRSGGINSLKTLGRQFRFMDKSGNGTVDREELERAMNIMLRGCRLNLGPSDMKMVFDIFDHDKDGRVSYNEFIRGIRGKMNDRRVNIVKQAFQCFDTDRSGHVTLEECATMYDVSRHPKVQTGQWSEQKAMLEFMKQWDKDNSGTVTEAEFLEYYSWISPSIDEDDYFELMIRNAWHISGGKGQAENTATTRLLVTWPDGRQTVESLNSDLGLGKDLGRIRERFLLERHLDARDIVSIEL